jgi:hypothetical protein
MNKIVAFALPFAMAAQFPAFAQTAAAPTPRQAASSAGSEARIVPAATEDGDMTLEGFEGIACAPLYSQEVVPVGPRLGDDEKDTVAHTVVGTDCR